MKTRSAAAAFTLLELLTVLGIIALLAALLFPVFALVRAKGQQTACTSNLRQIGAALFAYMQDNDETAPNGKIPATIFPNKPQFPMNSGWAGRIFPYIKNADVYRCPSDSTQGDPAKNSVPVSYGINENMATVPHVASWTASAHTVLLFAVENNTARVFLVDEGIDGGLVYPNTTSAAGTGVELWDLGTDVPPNNAPNKGYITRYATGYLDNHEPPDCLCEWLFSPEKGRHSTGANYLAADGHVVWRVGNQISAGYNGSGPAQAQAHTGCKNIGGLSNAPCAEGTGIGKHVLTFSTK